ncbi:hypothetical protein DVK05_02185 [Halorubrum sp. Atlit-8R]|uniref:KEOPS complex subunit Pcc1 n=1 Tax=unclassified Halorubrum TaxID=2642239 RepID=UPI000EF2688D|nr:MULTISPECIES: KEOPS complex subunit Pcc1 [unclassified Halorubrum]RLM71230.1 hypothetical protein DVK08_03575 [Halorubrum sp. Atlit-9R]RLM72098.1 hypothetical protein DVK08_08320 [Halorubrum sp. Atlit-9R]RLM82617.1 hypothetical protein DVK05_02185 [Halorubrum sp. Atlit-8R]
MAGDASPGADAARTATVRTEHADAATVAAALAPDETDSMRTRVDGDVVACAVERPTTGGLQSTLDDHLVNLRVADHVIERARDHADAAHADSLDSADEPQTTDTDTQPDT